MTYGLPGIGAFVVGDHEHARVGVERRDGAARRLVDVHARGGGSSFSKYVPGP